MHFPCDILRTRYSFALLVAFASSSYGRDSADSVYSLRQTIYELAADSTGSSNDLENLQSISETAKTLRRTIPILIDRLDDKSHSVRTMAAQALGEFGPTAAEAVPALLQRLQKEELPTKEPFVTALGKIGPAAKSAVPFLLHELKNKDDKQAPAGFREPLNVAIMRALGAIKDPVAIQPLIEMLYGTDMEWVQASYALASIGEPAVQPLIDSLARDSRQRHESADALGRIGRPALPAIRQVLKDGSAAAKIGAIYALRAARNYAHVLPKEIVPQLIAALADSAVRLEAIHALGSFHSEAAEAVPLLISFLRDSDPAIRGSAAETFGFIGPAAKDAIPHLIPLLNDPLPSVRAKAATGLGIGPEAKIVLPRLIKALDDPEREVRIAAAYSLAQIGIPAAPAINRLISLFADENRDQGRAAVAAIGGHGAFIPGIGGDAVEPLRKALASENDKVRERSALALGNLGALAKAAIPDLENALDDTAPAVRQFAAWALGRMGSAAESALPALIAKLNDEDLRVREKVVEGLGQIGSASAVPALTELIQKTLGEHPENKLQKQRAAILRETIVALGKIGPEAQFAIPMLRQVTESHERDYLRAEAAIAWGKIDPNSATPALIRLLQAANPLLMFSFSARDVLPLLSGSDEQTIPLLRKTALDGTPSERIIAATALARFDTEAGSALGLLITELHDESSAVQALVAQALGTLGEQARPAVGSLIPLLRSEDLRVRVAAVQSLRQIRDEKALDPLRDFMSAHPLEESFVAAWAVLAIDSSVDEAWQVLAHGVRSENPNIRASVLDALADLKSTRAFSIAREARNDPNPFVRRKALELLTSIKE